MRKASDFLKEKRESIGIGLVEVSKETKIPIQQLINIETGAWQSFTSYAYLQGVVKNYANYLKLNDEEMLSYLRRDIKEYRIKFIRETDYVESSRRFSDKWYIYLIIFLVVGFFILQVFLSWQKPLLQINDIPKSISVNQSLVIKGKTEQGVLLYLNGEQIYQDEQGKFEQNLYFKNKGDKLIKIKAVGVNGKEEEKDISITIEDN